MANSYAEHIGQLTKDVDTYEGSVKNYFPSSQCFSFGYLEELDVLSTF